MQWFRLPLRATLQAQVRTIKLEERLGRRKSKKSPAIQASLRACVCARRGLPGPRRRPRALFRAAPGAAAIFDTGGKQAAPADRARQLPGTAAVVRPLAFQNHDPVRTHRDMGTGGGHRGRNVVF